MATLSLSTHRITGHFPSKVSHRLIHQASFQTRLPSPSLCRQRYISSTALRAAPRSPGQTRAKHRSGPFTVASAGIFITAGIGLWYYLQSEKDRLRRQRVRDASKGAGKPRVGGEFDLIDQDGRSFSSDDMKGKFALIYFGFTHCPDICPDELDKMARIIDLVKTKRGLVLRPLFITCDPNRDGPLVVKTYLSEFHKDIIGLTGTWEQIRDVCKKYRVYFSTPPHVKPGQDYLVDHSIYFYLMDPDGEFIEVIGREHSAPRGAKLITDHIGDWTGPLDRS